MPLKDPAARLAYRLRYERENRDKIRRGRRASYWRNRERTIERMREWRYLHWYGITPTTYAELLNRQGGKCAICHSPPKKNRLAVDHCHETGRVRGLLCARCNACIARFEDDADSLERAAAYLRT